MLFGILTIQEALEPVRYSLIRVHVVLFRCIQEVGMFKDRKNTAIYIAYDDEKPLDLAFPEKNLLRAILLLAMSDVRKTGEVGRQAKEFFLSGEDDYVFSFKAICNQLEVDEASILKVVGIGKETGATPETGESNNPD